MRRNYSSQRQTQQQAQDLWGDCVLAQALVPAPRPASGRGALTTAIGGPDVNCIVATGIQLGRSSAQQAASKREVNKSGAAALLLPPTAPGSKASACIASPSGRTFEDLFADARVSLRVRANQDVLQAQTHQHARQNVWRMGLAPPSEGHDVLSSGQHSSTGSRASSSHSSQNTNLPHLGNRDAAAVASGRPHAAVLRHDSDSSNPDDGASNLHSSKHHSHSILSPRSVCGKQHSFEAPRASGLLDGFGALTLPLSAPADLCTHSPTAAGAGAVTGGPFHSQAASLDGPGSPSANRAHSINHPGDDAAAAAAAPAQQATHNSNSKRGSSKARNIRSPSPMRARQAPRPSPSTQPSPARGIVHGAHAAAPGPGSAPQADGGLLVAHVSRLGSSLPHQRHPVAASPPRDVVLSSSLPHPLTPSKQQHLHLSPTRSGSFHRISSGSTGSGRTASPSKQPHQHQQHHSGDDTGGQRQQQQQQARSAVDPQEEMRKAQERLDAYRKAKEERAAQLEAEEGARRLAAAEARNAQRAERERRREEIYAMNAILRMCDQARAQALLDGLDASGASAGGAGGPQELSV